MTGNAIRPDGGSTAATGAGHERGKSVEDIREQYAEEAGRWDRLERLNRLFTGRFRRRIFSRAEGRVLDVACGIGTNRRYLPDSVEYVGVDLSPEMLATARERFDREGLDGTLVEMDAGSLEFGDDSFDTVVSSLSTCTFPEPVESLREMGRVCRPDGRILLFEHGRSDVGPIARFQDWRAEPFYENHACRWNQEPQANVEAAGLAVVEATDFLLGILTTVEARPADGA